jgi:hypothetical protein
VSTTTLAFQLPYFGGTGLAQRGAVSFATRQWDTPNTSNFSVLNGTPSAIPMALEDASNTEDFLHAIGWWQHCPIRSQVLRPKKKKKRKAVKTKQIEGIAQKRLKMIMVV